MSASDAALSSLERQRLHLENNIRELQKSLYKWRMWEAEYDGLKLTLQEEASRNASDDNHVKSGDNEGEYMLKTALDYISSSSPWSGEQSVLTAEEVRNIVCGSSSTGPSQLQTRTKEQVLSVLDRRIDYVRENVSVLEKRLRDAERKLETWIGAIAVEDEEDGDGETKGGLLPVTEILEELDEEGNVVKGETMRAGDSAMELLDVLKKAGVDGLEDGKLEKRKEQIRRETKEAALASKKHDSRAAAASAQADKRDETREISEEQPASGAASQRESKKEIVDPGTGDKAKDVPDEKPTSAPASPKETKESTPGDGDEQTTTASVAPSDVTSMSNVSTKGSSTAGTVQEQDGNKEDDENESVVMEVDETPEEAALRREMIQYGLQEVGAVVAELELDEDASEFSITDEEEYDYDDDDDEEEDEYGRSTRRILDEDYHRKMRELEKKLNAKGLLNIGPDPSILPEEVQQELNGEFKRATIQDSVDESKASDKKSQEKPKKRVAFAEELDIAPDPVSTTPPLERKDKVVASPEVAPVRETVVERTGRDSTNGVSETKPAKKVSRFKSARQANESTPVNSPSLMTSKLDISRAQPPRPSPPNIPLFPAKPSEPKPFSQPIIYPEDSPSDVPPSAKSSTRASNKIVQDTLIERPPSSNPDSTPLPPELDPDDFDEALHRREIATEFYRLRNRKIQQEGGFLRDGEEEVVLPVCSNEDDEPGEEDGRRKMSRFKAARVRNK
ncbi:hypothetical protein VTO42DRAFT_1282 [Malbranchea cinnamomea]